MIPLYLRISGFLSYRDPAELDFTGFDLACISGSNGAGKSSLLDAITWALFGQARRRDEALINLQSDVAEVVLAFRYESADYRILRSLRRGKGAILELQTRAASDAALDPQQLDESAWKPLTERTLRETQARIEQILRLDYDTFINASFFLQGKADSFAQQTPARRKEVLGNILGFEVWESYKARSAEKRRGQEAELGAVAGRLGEIAAELSEEGPRRQRLAGLEAELSRLIATRKSQAAALEGTHKAHAVLDRQRLLLSEQTAALERARTDLVSLQSRLADRQAARLEILGLAEQADEVDAAYKSWRATMAQLEKLEAVARTFRDQERQRAPFIQEIASEQARLDQELAQLTSRQVQLRERSASVTALESEMEQAAARLAAAEARVQERDQLQHELATARASIAEKAAENNALRPRMDEIKERMQTLEDASGASCPLCGQPLSDQHRKSTLDGLLREGRKLGDQHRLNNTSLQGLKAAASGMESRWTDLAGADQDRLALSRSVTQLAERIQVARAELRDWEAVGLVRLEDIRRILGSHQFAPEARAKLAALDAELVKLGYDAAAHDKLRALEADQRAADQAYTQLQSARAALAPLENEIRNVEAQIAERDKAISRQESEVSQTQAEFDSIGADLPDLAGAERMLFDLQEQENGLNQEVGAARQKVAVLESLRQRASELESARQALALSVGHYRMLESSFGKDGVPALLIEQALPEVESHANEILDRLSDGALSVHFETQAAYRDRKRGDLRETLEIKISDGAGKRDYEMYSGGEAFRVNFAIRLALSQVLAGRTGARLQTLVIDEGFGSQDNQGRQRLIETINLVRHDFAKILLISHLDELKDAFPTRIEVEKTARGSVLKVS